MAAFSAITQNICAAHFHYGMWNLLKEFGLLPEYRGIPKTLTSQAVPKLKEAHEFVNFIKDNCDLPPASFDIWYHVKLYPQDYLHFLERLISVFENQNVPELFLMEE